MKNLLISLIVITTLFTANTASADRTLEKKEKVVRLTIKEAKFVFSKPTTTLIKSCVDNWRYECVYKVVGKGRREKEVKIYEYKAHDYVFPLYVFEEKVAIKN